MSDLTTVDDMHRAAVNIRGVAVRTPLVRAATVPGLWLKPESLQPMGAFKIRGAMHALASLPEAARAAGVVTHSSGIHGQALALAALHFGVRCVVVMPDVATPIKVDAVRALGAVVVLVPPAERDSRMAEIASAEGLAVVPPFDHPDVISGQATVGLEIVEDVSSGALPDLAAVLVPIGGGGLAAGVASAVKLLRPSVRVIGVEPELAADAAASLDVGAVVRWPVERTYRTAADGLRTNLSDLTFAHLAAHLDGIVTVTEDDILSTVGTLALTYRLVAEPSGAVAPAAWLHHAADLRERFDLAEGPVVAVVTGGNIEPALLASIMNSSPVPPRSP